MSDTKQSILPGFKRYIGEPPRDYRPWTDGHGNKIDVPRPKGPTFGGKTIPPLVGSDGRPIRLGSYQLIRDARGAYVVVDWSKTLDPLEESKSHESGATSALLGREMFKSKSRSEANNVMIVLYARDRDVARGLAPDPAPQHDKRGKEIRFGSLLLCRYARGPMRGKFVAVNTAQLVTNLKREIPLKAKTLKGALFVIEQEYKKRIARQKKRDEERAKSETLTEIRFEVPEGFGADAGVIRTSFEERTYPEPDSISWITIVRLYARNGKWCRTAELMFSDESKMPAVLLEECKRAREAELSKLEEK